MSERVVDAVRDWLLDEEAHAGREHLDADYVATYDAKAGFDPSGDVALLQRFGLDRESVVVDIGAGTGTFALAVAPLCRRVIAVDVSAAMVQALRQKVELQQSSNVECVHGGFLTYDHPGRPVDFIYSRNALHHLPEFWKVVALQRASSMLRAGGVLRLRDITFSCEPADIEATIERWLSAAAEREQDGWTRSELEAHVREEYSTFTWLLEPVLDRTGFEIADARYDPSRIFAEYVCRKTARKAR